jgi:hypothetical protein
MPTEKKWRSFERLVAAIHTAADAGAQVKWGDSINGRQFDVTIKFRKGLYDHLTVVECKDTERPVPVEKIDAFVTKASDVHANVAVIASTAGFQSGAIETAKRHNINLIQITPSTDIDVAAFGAEWGDPTDALHIKEVSLEYVEGERKRLPTEANVLTYYMIHTILQSGIARMSLDSVVSRGLCEVTDTYTDFVIPVSNGTQVIAPDDGEIPLKPLAAIHVRAAIVKAKTLHGPNKIDPSLIMPDVNVVNIQTGEKVAFRQGDLALGIDNVFEPGQFYESPGLGFYHYCETVRDGIATVHLVESFQHGQLLQATVTMEAKYENRYIPVTDEQILKRLKRRLDRMKAT